MTLLIYLTTENMMDRSPVRGNQGQFLVHDIVDLSSTGDMMDRSPVQGNQSQFLLYDIVDLSFYR